MNSSPPPATPTGLWSRLRAEFEKREFLRHFTTLLTGTALAQIVQMVTMVVIGRLFTPAQFGVYGTIMLISQAILPLAAGRYDLAIVLPKRDNDARIVLRLATVVNTGVAVVTIAVMLLAGDWLGRMLNIPAGDLWLLWLVGPLTWLLAQVVVIGYWLTRTKNFATVSKNKMTNAVALAVGRIGAGLLRSGVGGLMVATVAAQLFTWLTLRHRVRGQLATDGEHSSMKELAREYRKMPLLNGPNALVDSVRAQGVPLLIANRFGGGGDLGPLGQFRMAWTLLSAPIGLLNGAISQIFFQRLSVTRRGRMLALIVATLKRSVLLGTVPFALIWLLGPWALPFMLGEQWRPAGEIARALVPWLFLNFLTSPISTLFVVVRRQATMLVFAIFFAALPLWVLYTSTVPLLPTIERVSWSMAAMLTVFILLSLWVARSYDRGTPDPSEADEAVPSSPAASSDSSD